MKSGLNKATSTAKAIDSFAFTAVEELQETDFSLFLLHDLLTFLNKVHNIWKPAKQTNTFSASVDSGTLYFIVLE